jgi:hypothetical protein
MAAGHACSPNPEMHNLQLAERAGLQDEPSGCDMRVEQREAKHSNYVQTLSLTSRNLPLSNESELYIRFPHRHLPNELPTRFLV